MKITKEKVIARLVKWGSNKDFVTPIVERNFNYAVKYYSTVSKIAEVIMNID
jgi:hypothetical protein